jgi:hypothetical protein
MRWLVAAGVTAIVLGCIGTGSAGAATKTKHTARNHSRVAHTIPHRAPTRIEIYGSRAPLHRDCRAVFDERWIPAWGGRVLYAGQDCWWSRN